MAEYDPRRCPHCRTPAKDRGGLHWCYVCQRFFDPECHRREAERLAIVPRHSE